MTYVGGAGLGREWGVLRGRAGCHLTVGKSQRKSGRNDNAREVSGRPYKKSGEIKPHFSMSRNDHK